MTYAELIKHLFVKSGMSIKDYAEQIEFSTAQLSLVLNNARDQKGTLKMLQACLRHEGQDIQDYLWIPESAESKDEKRILRAFKDLKDEKRRQTALSVLENFAAAEIALERQHRGKRS